MSGKMNHKLRRWLAFFGSLVLLGVFIFGALPLGQRIPYIGDVLRNNQNRGINVSGIFYTEVEEVSDYSLELQQRKEKSQPTPSSATHSPE